MIHLFQHFRLTCKLHYHRAKRIIGTVELTNRVARTDENLLFQDITFYLVTIPNVVNNAFLSGVQNIRRVETISIYLSQIRAVQTKPVCILKLWQESSLR